MDFRMPLGISNIYISLASLFPVMSTIKYSVIVPAYNEEKAIRRTIKAVQKVMSSVDGGSEIIVIDDGSTDRTLSNIAKIEGLVVHSNPYNLGYGASIKRGIRFARGEWILIIDADGTYAPEEIPKLLEHIPHFDMVVGARGGKNIPFFRKPAKWVLGKIANFLSGQKIPDLNSGMRVFRKSLAEEYFHLLPSGFSLTTTITLAAFCNEYTVKYVRINYEKRIGTSSISPIRDFFGFLALLFRIMIFFKPLRFFLLPGLLLISAGILFALNQFILVGRISQFPVLSVLAGIQICFMGILADMLIKIQKKSQR
jgi:polyisoprenyl-phosphate glycosyltransferase